MSKEIHVFFFRGLSTYGSDHAKWAIFDFGPMYKSFARAFEARGIHFHPVTGMGAGTLHEVTSRALEFLRAHPVWNSGQPVHFVGHSAGGLAARLAAEALLADPSLPAGKIASLLTIATPNRGARMAQLCLDMPLRRRGSALFLRAFGYNIASKADFFRELTIESVANIFSRSEAVPVSREPVSVRGMHLASLVCSAPRREWCWALRVIHLVKGFRELHSESDGVVDKDSQAFGQVLAELKIDHFRQVGLFGKRWMFENMCDITADFFRRV